MKTIRAALAIACLSFGLGAAAPAAAWDLPTSLLPTGPTGAGVRDASTTASGTPPASPFFVRVGGSAVLPDADVRATAGGRAVPGRAARLGDVGAFYAEVGAYLLPSVSASLSAGFPPAMRADGAGALKPLGRLYDATVGVPVLSASYHFDGAFGLRPYLGAGVAWAHAFAYEAGAVRAPHLSDAFGPAVVAGVDYAIDDRWGVFLDVKKAFVSQRFEGFASPAPGLPAVVPTTASVRSDPLIVSVGVQRRF